MRSKQQLVVRLTLGLVMGLLTLTFSDPRWALAYAVAVIIATLSRFEPVPSLRYALQRFIETRRGERWRCPECHTALPNEVPISCPNCGVYFVIRRYGGCEDRTGLRDDLEEQRRLAQATMGEESGAAIAYAHAVEMLDAHS